MEQSGIGRDVQLMGAQTKLSREDCALGMVQKLNTNGAALKDAQIKFKREDCALGMEQRSKRLNTNDAAVKGAQI
jgi:hypothetical protein